MDDFDYDNLDEEKESLDSEEANERLLHFSRDMTFSKLKKIHALESFKIENIIKEIEETFSLIKEFQLPDFCLKLWLQLIDIKNELKIETQHCYELSFALDELLYLAKYITKGGDQRGLVQ